MPMPANILKVTQKGTIATDVWQTACYFRAKSTPPTLPIPAAFGTAIANASRTCFVNLAPYTSAMVSWTGVRLDWYGSGGLLIASLDATATGGSAGGSAAGNHPPQTCVVVSMRSAGTGPTARGRMYWPLLSGTVSTATGTFPSADASSIAGHLRTFLLAVGADTTWSAAGWDPVVVSQTAGGLDRLLTHLKVGNVFDTQRRRRNKVIETYSTVTVP